MSPPLPGPDHRIIIQHLYPLHNRAKKNQRKKRKRNPGLKKRETHLKLAVSIQTPAILTTHLRVAASEDGVVVVVSGALASIVKLILAFIFVVVVEFVAATTAAEHRSVLKGNKYPLSRANCSRQMGRKRVSETMTKTSLENEGGWISWFVRARRENVPSESVTQPPVQLLFVG